ncbi:hypothetical protein R1flu_015516 [Riccia fluitans]|uniref:Uncharacterized protein n=1 Tax=Riccia fluitans TaxID=41844 RepID=A0ABD1YJI0_9MARC
MTFIPESSVPPQCSAMDIDERMKKEHCEEYSRSIHRMCEVIEREGKDNEAVMAIVAEVSKVVAGFQVLGRTYGVQLMKRVQEVRVLEKEKEILERKLHRLGMPSEVSSSHSGGPAGLSDLAQESGSCNLKGDSDRKCGEEFDRLELELAELRSAYTARTLDLRDSRQQALSLEAKLRKAESSAETKENARLEPSKAHVDEIRHLKKVHVDEISELKKVHADEICHLKKSHADEVSYLLKSRVEQLRIHAEEMNNLEKARLEEVRNLKEEIDRMRNELQEVDKQASTVGEELRQERGRNEELIEELRQEVAKHKQLEEAHRGEMVRSEQLAELWKNDSEEHAELRRQYKTLKAYLRCLGTKSPGDLHIELKVLELIGLEEEITISLKMILERSIKSSAGESTQVNIPAPSV